MIYFKKHLIYFLCKIVFLISSLIFKTFYLISLRLKLTNCKKTFIYTQSIEVIYMTRFETADCRVLISLLLF